jgi:hypothetical protein
MAKWTMKRVVKSSFHGWGAVILVGVVLTAISVLDSGTRTPTVTGSATSTSPPIADGSTGCQLRVSAAELRVRSSPSTDGAQVEILSEGAVVDGTRVVTNGFRELEGNRWAADQFLTPVAGTNCT